MKDNISKIKRLLTEWEEIFANNLPDQGLISKIHKELMQFSPKTPPPTKNLLKKWAEVLERHFSRGHMQMASKHMGRYSVSVIVREMQTKTPMKYHFPHVRMAIVKKTTNRKC